MKGWSDGDQGVVCSLHQSSIHMSLIPSILNPCLVLRKSLSNLSLSLSVLSQSISLSINPVPICLFPHYSSFYPSVFPIDHLSIFLSPSTFSHLSILFSSVNFLHQSSSHLSLPINPLPNRLLSPWIFSPYIFLHQPPSHLSFSPPLYLTFFLSPLSSSSPTIAPTLLHIGAPPRLLPMSAPQVLSLGLLLTTTEVFPFYAGHISRSDSQVPPPLSLSVTRVIFLKD